MRFQPIEQSIDGHQTCDFELEPSYVCGREASHEVLDFESDHDGDFQWCEYRCPLHAVEAFQPGVEGAIEHDEETDEPICVQSFVAYGWRRDWGYVVWRGDSREGGWVAVKDPMDLDTAVDLLGGIERLMGV
ncbi:hypothetical protein SEA_GENAMY16_44 [Gordonia phage Genamy16]|uniref:Uncharacterized protein n=2 Tax=Lambovirus TaxID=2843412 RepID=A0A9E7Q4Z0_9CAUD|nr:hypothetical protein SEA_GENAMY16_44 [Gordonia phage Genamy16]UVF61749.1 hypothetical protein SEA_NOVASHARKS_43 [Gordonia phage NovaSharks]UVK63126.1 hypothetical protein SEA_RUMI_43 [Gordonia phage Rumi]WNM65348.1 hypothetical protein SEA_ALYSSAMIRACLE_44 [Gordonia phage Alyssamiracle]